MTPMTNALDPVEMEMPDGLSLIDPKGPRQIPVVDSSWSLLLLPLLPLKEGRVC